MSAMKNCLLAGVGGQGTVLASRLIAQAAMERGEFARTAETIGMAQRGGCVVSHVRIGTGAFSPLIPKGEADLLLAFEPGEAVRCLEYLHPQGTAVAAVKAVQPVTATLGATYDGGAMLAYLRENAARLFLLDGEAVCAACGSPKVLNTALLGAAIGADALGVSLEEMERTIRAKVPERFLNMNLKALRLGHDAVRAGSAGKE